MFRYGVRRPNAASMFAEFSDEDFTWARSMMTADQIRRIGKIVPQLLKIEAEIKVQNELVEEVPDSFERSMEYSQFDEDEEAFVTEPWGWDGTSAPEQQITVLEGKELCDKVFPPGPTEFQVPAVTHVEKYSVTEPVGVWTDWRGPHEPLKTDADFVKFEAGRVHRLPGDPDLDLKNTGDLEPDMSWKVLELKQDTSEEYEPIAVPVRLLGEGYLLSPTLADDLHRLRWNEAIQLSGFRAVPSHDETPLIVVSNGSETDGASQFFHEFARASGRKVVMKFLRPCDDNDEMGGGYEPFDHKTDCPYTVTLPGGPPICGRKVDPMIPGPSSVGCPYWWLDGEDCEQIEDFRPGCDVAIIDVGACPPDDRYMHDHLFVTWILMVAANVKHGGRAIFRVPRIRTRMTMAMTSLLLRMFPRGRLLQSRYSRISTGEYFICLPILRNNDTWFRENRLKMVKLAYLGYVLNRPDLINIVAMGMLTKTPDQFYGFYDKMLNRQADWLAYENGYLFFLTKVPRFLCPANRGDRVVALGMTNLIEDISGEKYYSYAEVKSGDARWPVASLCLSDSWKASYITDFRDRYDCLDIDYLLI